TIVQTVTINTTGITEAAAAGVMIYPVPSNNKVTLSWSEPVCTSVNVYDLNGQRVYANDCTGKGKLTLDVATWPAGIYAAILQLNYKQIQARFVVE
ncbi:MAG: T9SS type A sorting domain-containing protein, partial [Bacteroidota bacterium]